MMRVDAPRFQGTFTIHIDQSKEDARKQFRKYCTRFSKANLREDSKAMEVEFPFDALERECKGKNPLQRLIGFLNRIDMTNEEQLVFKHLQTMKRKQGVEFSYTA